MHRTPVFVPGVVLLLVASILLTGCTSSETTTEQTVQPDTTITTPAIQGKFSAGDIVRNQSSDVETAWLVIGYNPESDTYELAPIYPNPDGEWGYRTSNRTQKTSRSVLETGHMVNAGTMLPSSVPVVPTAIVTRVVTTRMPFPSKTVPNPDFSTIQPSPERSIPDKGYAGTSVVLSDLAGKNFLAGANVTLSRNDSVDMIATMVNVVSPTSITCSFAIPSNAKTGTWDLTVTNPNGLSGTLKGYFTIHKVAVTSIDPGFAFVGPSPEITVTGSNFQPGARVTLKSVSGKPDIEARSVIFDNENKLRVLFNIPAGSFGTYDIIVSNPEGSYGTKGGGFSIT
ncbi:MAG TPA: hypothetical protein P5013_03615 [Methanoregula sp.]|nr:hypothetical protein [Methanoregula sp.]